MKNDAKMQNLKKWSNNLKTLTVCNGPKQQTNNCYNLQVCHFKLYFNVFTSIWGNFGFWKKWILLAKIIANKRTTENWIYKHNNLQVCHFKLNWYLLFVAKEDEDVLLLGRVELFTQVPAELLHLKKIISSYSIQNWNNSDFKSRSDG